MLAVIKTGGKQYLVSPGQKIKVEKIEGEAGKEVSFDEVLLLDKDGDLQLGTPLVKGVKISGKILSQGKSKKVIILKYKAKKRTKVKKGHRQPFTEIEIGKF